MDELTSWQQSTCSRARVEAACARENQGQGQLMTSARVLHRASYPHASQRVSTASHASSARSKVTLCSQAIARYRAIGSVASTPACAPVLCPRLRCVPRSPLSFPRVSCCLPCPCCFDCKTLSIRYRTSSTDVIAIASTQTQTGTSHTRRKNIHYRCTALYSTALESRSPFTLPFESHHTPLSPLPLIRITP